MLLGQEAEHLQHGDLPQQSRPSWVPLKASCGKYTPASKSFGLLKDFLVIAPWLLCICVECEPCTGIDSRQVIRCHFLEFVKLKMNLVGNRCYLFDD